MSHVIIYNIFMPSSFLLRKKILSVLQDHILPDLRRNGVSRMVTAYLPLHVPLGITTQKISTPTLLDVDAEDIYPLSKKWNHSQMLAIPYPSLYCVIDGEADLAMGITDSMLESTKRKSNLKEQPGGYIFSLGAPAYFLVPPNVPQRTSPPWQRDEPHEGQLQIFMIRFSRVGALCTIMEMTKGDYNVEYSLLIEDEYLVSSSRLLVDESRQSAPNKEILLAQMKTLMLRIERALQKKTPLMTHNVNPRFPDSDSPSPSMPHHPLVERAHIHIQQHLHEPLTPATIAAHVQVTPDHLSRILKAYTGYSTMHYVTLLRMEAARLLLCNGDLSIREISKLVGYHKPPHFSKVFRQYAGESPLRFRQLKKIRATTY